MSVYYTDVYFLMFLFLHGYIGVRIYEGIFISYIKGLKKNHTKRYCYYFRQQELQQMSVFVYTLWYIKYKIEKNMKTENQL